jgi:hypothetical protein
MPIPLRLPTVNSDANSWGDILNNYLQQSLLAADGTLVATATNPYTGLTNPNLASTSKAGLVQLTNDLSGSAASPTVTGLQGNNVASGTPTDGYVLTWSASGSTWQPAAPSSGGGSSIDLDGGNASSVFGGITALDGGNST